MTCALLQESPTALPVPEAVAPSANTPEPSASVRGFVHSVETCGSVDGPGLRYVAFLAGCPMRCVYCHNPDTQSRAHSREKTAGQVIADVLRYRHFIRRGGLTVSGGEPLMQPAFVCAIFEEAKAAGIHTALDTSGCLGDLADDRLLAATDLVLLDIKSWEPDLYKSVTGVSLEPTLRFAKRLESKRIPVWIRFVLVPGITDGESNIRGLADYVGRLTNVARVEILPFHKFGEAKYKALGLPCKLTETPAASNADAERAKAIFAEEGVSAN